MAAPSFTCRKRDLSRDHFHRRAVDTRKLSWLDLGCGRGEPLSVLGRDFAAATGCDPSAGMMAAGGLAHRGIQTRVQCHSQRIPAGDAEFDVLTLVCVLHHVPPPDRPRLLREASLVLKPGGTLAVIEHNPLTLLIVTRTPADAEAVLVRPAVALRSLCAEPNEVTDEMRRNVFSAREVESWPVSTLSSGVVLKAVPAACQASAHRDFHSSSAARRSPG
jgi:ubiquinone/menaquinone biosynthesis C-methylase UbiE